MVKANVIDAVASEFNMTKAQAQEVAAFVLNTVIHGAETDGKCCFGQHRFILKKFKPRKCRNPQTGEAVMLPARTAVQYKQGTRS